MSTCKALIDELAIDCNDPLFEKRSQAIYAQIMTDSQDFLVDYYELFKKIDESLSMTADQSSIGDLPDDFIRFTEQANDERGGQIVLGIHGDIVLTPTSTEILDLEKTKWRETVAGTPQYFYLSEGSKVGLNIYPKISAAVLASKGNKVFVKYVFRCDPITYSNTLCPFGNTQRFRGLEELLKMRSLWKIKFVDKELTDADRYKVTVDKILEEKEDLYKVILRNPQGARFDPRYKT